MRSKLFYLLILLFISCLAILIHTFFLGGIGGRNGQLVIRSNPDTTVFIDSQAVGRTPFVLTMKPGDYMIKLIPNSLDPSKSIKALPWESRVVIYPRYETYIRRELSELANESSGEVVSIKKSDNALASGKGEISVDSSPDGAIITLDGQDIGVSPDVYQNISPGTHDISVYLSRFDRRSIQVQVQPGHTTSIKFDLSVDGDFENKYPFITTFEASSSASFPEISQADPSLTKAPTPTKTPEKVIVIDTPTGYLRVRSGPSVSEKEISQIKPGEIYEYISEQNNWVKIRLTDGNEGWVSADYVNAN
jgi:hypothetical protein